MCKQLKSRKGCYVVQLCIVVLTGIVMDGCGAVTVHHVPEPSSISSNKIPDFRGGQPLDIKNGQSASEEIEIGTVGLGKVVGSLQQWTNAAVSFIKGQLSQRGATIVDAAPKALTLSITKAEVRAIPFVGVSTSTVILRVTTADGSVSDFEGSGSSLAPLSAINGATTDAVKKMLKDQAISTYMRR